MSKKEKKTLKAILFGFIGIMIIYNPTLFIIEYLYECEFSYHIHMIPIYIFTGTLVLSLYAFVFIFINKL